MENKEPLAEIKDQEIDIAQQIRLMWAHRRFITKVTGCVMLIGLLMALFGQVEFTSSTIIVPQTGKSAGRNNLSGLAAMAGINLGGVEQSDVISPLLYPQIVYSVPFQKELMRTPIKFNDYDQPITLLDYYTGEEYQKFSLTGFVAKYTIGLPGLLKQAIMGEKPDVQFDTVQGMPIEVMSRAENQCRKVLKELIGVGVDNKNGYISLSATMPEALAAAQVASKTQLLLREYITRFKVQKAKTNLDFIEARYQEVKADFDARQRSLAAFQDANRNIVSAIARTRESKLQNEYNLAYAIYSDLAQQREQMSIKVKEDAPEFTVVEPVTVPVEKSAPRRGMIMVVSLFVGFVLSIGLVLFLPFLAGMSDARWLNQWREKSDGGQDTAAV